MNFFDKIIDNENSRNNNESDNESDLDISWIKEQEKLQQINENYFKEPMDTIDFFFIYINSNDCIEIINYEKHDLVLRHENSIIPNEYVIELIEQKKYLSGNKYKIQDVLLYNVSLNPENIQSYSQNDNLLDSSSKFFESLSVMRDFIIPPSIFIFHKINSIFFIFKQLQPVQRFSKPVLKSILKLNSNSGMDKNVQKTKKKVRILEENSEKEISSNNRITRKKIVNI